MFRNHASVPRPAVKSIHVILNQPTRPGWRRSGSPPRLAWVWRALGGWHGFGSPRDEANQTRAVARFPPCARVHQRSRQRLGLRWTHATQVCPEQQGRAGRRPAEPLLSEPRPSGSGTPGHHGPRSLTVAVRTIEDASILTNYTGVEAALSHPGGDDPVLAGGFRGVEGVVRGADQVVRVVRSVLPQAADADAHRDLHLGKLFAHGGGELLGDPPAERAGRWPPPPEASAIRLPAERRNVRARPALSPADPRCEPG